jgi:hypothetical protein
MERDKLIKIADKILTPGYNIEVVNKQNLEVLNREPNTPCVIYSNHTVLDDPLVMCILLHEESPESLNKLILPVSEHHAKFINFPPYAIGVGVGRAAGIKMPEIVQSYRRRGEKVTKKLVEKSEDLNMQFGKLLMKSIPEGYRIAVWPEGHRSKNGSLLPAEPGVGFMLVAMERLKRQGKIENGLFIPIYTKYRENRMVQYNPINKPDVSLEIGQPLSIDSVINECSALGDRSQFAKTATHVLMHHIAEMMPPEKQGFYSPAFYEDTLLGRYEQRSDKKGRVFIYDNIINSATSPEFL